MYATVNADPSTTAASANRPAGSPVSSDSRAASLATNPISGGTPAIEAPASTATAHTHGIARPTALSERRSRPPAAWSTMPTTRNSAALNSACAGSMATPARAAASVPAPNRMVRKPSWLTVP